MEKKKESNFFSLRPFFNWKEKGVPALPDGNH